MCDLRLACPACHHLLQVVDDDTRLCPRGHGAFRLHQGVWRLISKAASEALQPILDRYRQVRDAEGWGAPDAAYYRALPFVDLSGRHSAIWRLRGNSYRSLIAKIIEPLEHTRRGALRILDLGAGNCWLSYRIRERGHLVAAIDISDDPQDGLGAYRHYPAAAFEGAASFLPIQATFDALPFPAGEFHLAVFNGAAHYSRRYDESFAEALRTLRDDGLLVVMDSPFYRWRVSGARMLREQEERFRSCYGVDTRPQPAEGFLTPDLLDQLSRSLRIDWQVFWPRRSWRIAVRRWQALATRQREPARFPLLCARRRASSPSFRRS